MKFKLKNYKYQSIKNYIKKTPVFFIYNGSNLNSKNQLKTNQTFYNNKLVCFKIHNSTAKLFIEHSIFKYSKLLLNGPIEFIAFNSKISNITTVKNLHPSMTLLGLKLNNKIYSSIQLKKISSFNYKKNVGVFNKSLTNILKITNKKLKNKSK